MLEEGRRLYLAGDLTGAAAVFRKALAGDPGNAEALNLLGVVALQTEDFPSAARLIRDAIAADGQNAGFHNNLGQALNAAADPRGAVDCYRRALDICPDDAGVHSNLGIALHELGRLEEAREAYEAALAIEAGDPEIHHNFGILLQELGHLDKAMGAYGRALRLAPEMEFTHLSLGSVFIELGNREAAIGAYMRAVEINPLYVDAHQAIKAVRWDSGEHERLDESYYHACALLPRSSEAHGNLGSALLSSDKTDDAETALDRALELDPDNAEAHSGLGRIQTLRGRFDDAVSEHLNAIRLDSENPFFHEELGTTYLKAGEAGRAVEAFHQAHGLNLRRSSILSGLTIAMNEAGDARVADLVDYDEFVTQRLIEVPDGFDSLDGFNEALHAELEKRHDDRPPPPGQTMRGGTQIPNALFTNPTGLTAMVKEKIAKALVEYISGLEQDAGHPFLRYRNPDFRFTGAWSTILHGSGYDGSHIHNEGWLSGVYYIKVPDFPDELWEAGEGCIQFGEPPPAFVSERNQAHRLIRPEPGTAVFFPSYYWHGVKPFTQEGVRHSIAFDIL